MNTKKSTRKETAAERTGEAVPNYGDAWIEQNPQKARERMQSFDMDNIYQNLIDHFPRAR